MVREPRQQPKEVGFGPEGVVARAEPPGDGCGMGAFIEAALAETNREGLDRAVGLARGCCGDEARIDAAAQIDTERHVAPEPQGHRSLEQHVESVQGLVEPALEGLRLFGKAPENVGLRLALLECDAFRGAELAEALEDRQRRRHVAERQIGIDGGRIDLRRVGHGLAQGRER